MQSGPECTPASLTNILRSIFFLLVLLAYEIIHIALQRLAGKKKTNNVEIFAYETRK